MRSNEIGMLTGLGRMVGLNGLEGPVWLAALAEAARQRLAQAATRQPLADWQLELAEAGLTTPYSLTLTWPGDGQVSLHTVPSFPWLAAQPGWQDSTWRDALALEAMGPILEWLGEQLPAFRTPPKLFWHAPQFFREHLALTLRPMSGGAPQRLSLRWGSDSRAAEELCHWARELRVDCEHEPEGGLDNDNPTEPEAREHTAEPPSPGCDTRILIAHVGLRAHEWAALCCGAGVLIDTPATPTGEPLALCARAGEDWRRVGEARQLPNVDSLLCNWWLKAPFQHGDKAAAEDALSVWTQPHAVAVARLAQALVDSSPALRWQHQCGPVYHLERGNRRLGQGRVHNRAGARVLEITEWLA